ncbi:hypothetical protein [uncultured Limosilactobacillus sp.]|uniref:hypothetical protein n=1 Tax=uncultured Limosilactobacillus sp. TaxID=2837629 RepID=UPI0025CE1FE2|nr:hypothetical protein [uncultured Limosilactobacillus sp.]
MAVKAYLQVTMVIPEKNREAAAKFYTDYREPLFKTIPGAETKQLLVRDEYVQVLHGFDLVEHAKAHLKSDMFTKHVFPGLKPTWSSDPAVCILAVAG